MTMTQMNVRIDEDLRKEGNVAFESIGLSPSRIVRDMWSYAAKNRNNPLKLKQALNFLSDAKESNSKQSACSPKVKAGWNIINEGLADIGVSISGESPLAYDELKERAYRELWKEKGLI